MRIVAYRLATIGLSLVGVSALTATAQEPSKGELTDTWKPNVKAVQRLGKVEEFEGYTLRPPQGYQLERANNMAAGAKAGGWTSRPRADGSKSSVAVMIASPVPPGVTLSQAADRLVSAVKSQRANWKQQEPELGKIGGLDFIRIQWSGTRPDGNLNLEGIIFIALDGENLVQLMSQDPANVARESLPLAEASILTFRKKTARP